MIYRFTKETDTDGFEWVEPRQAFRYFRDEEDPKAQELYNFACRVAEWLNYYNDYSSTAFGNPDLSRKEGWVMGYCAARHWDLRETREMVTIATWSGRKVMTFEKPKLPQGEIDNRREINKLRMDFGL